MENKTEKILSQKKNATEYSNIFVLVASLWCIANKMKLSTNQK